MIDVRYPMLDANSEFKKSFAKDRFKRLFKIMLKIHFKNTKSNRTFGAILVVLDS
jgi:hypothetical protein